MPYSDCCYLNAQKRGGAENRYQGLPI